MTSPKQFALLSLLIGGAVLVWFPQVRAILPGASPEETQGAAPVDAFGDGTQSAIEGLAPSSTSSAFSDQIPAAIMGSDVVSVPTAEGDALGMEWAVPLRNFGSRVDGPLLGSPEPEAVDEIIPITGLTLIRQWISRNPLSGLMESSGGNRAFLGGRIYQEGQQVASGWHLSAIHSESVVFHSAEDGEDCVIHLPRLGEGWRAPSKIGVGNSHDVDASAAEKTTTNSQSSEKNQ